MGGAGRAAAASLHLSPAAGTFTVGSTFTTSIFLNTDGDVINTIGAALTFPPDKLQLISPATGNSIISIWTILPNVDNQNGRLTLQGGIPGGIKVNNGLVMTLSFRVKSVGTVLLKFAENSKILLHDGKGTDVLKQLSNGVYQLTLPPPAGPIVVSDTHPDQSQWYPSDTVSLRWTTSEAVDSFSYVLNDDPVAVPDDIADGDRHSVTYQDAGDGQHYFHIKALQKGNWGGVTHFAVRADTEPPAYFPIDIIPGNRTTRRQPIVQFATTDALSGLDHYEFKLVPLRLQTDSSETVKQLFERPLFIEVTSPYLLPELDLGTYEVVVRAYDKAQNYREISARLSIVTALFESIERGGLHLGGILLPWPAVWGGALVLVALLALSAYLIRRWHQRVRVQYDVRDLPPEVKKDLKELKRYRAKYDGPVSLAVLVILLFGLMTGISAKAAVPPPVVNSVSRHISNEEIFYIGGRTAAPSAPVIVYLQNLKTGETQSQTVAADAAGEWFYRHDGFLSVGQYLLWTQGKAADEYSPPSPQIQLTVEPTAIQLGASRLSYEIIYLGVSLLLTAVIVGLVSFILFHYYLGRKKYRAFIREVREAEEAVRRGFAVLRRDIQAELAVIHKAKFNQALSAEEQVREKQLLSDLEAMERYVGKEVWDMEKYAHI